MSLDNIYMERALQLAKNGLGSTAPNPMVGAVIVFKDSIIGEGFTSPYGGSHAEVNAINAVQEKELLPSATLYVTLEPCCHHGKTPPCVDLIVEHKIPRVIIGILDPHVKVAGKGAKRLENAGCEVTMGILEKECREHHRRFITYHEEQRPYVILKWAECMNGFIAPVKDKRSIDAKPYWISNTYSRQLVHKWRSEEHAILVGTTTVLDDNPKLNVRKWFGKSPIRILIDKDLKIQKRYHILDSSVKTIVLTQVKDKSRWLSAIEYVVIDFSKNLPKEICNALFKYNITSVIIEGGAKTLQSFIDSDIWDEARVISGQDSLSDGLKAPSFSGSLQRSSKIGKDTLKVFRND